MKHYISPTFYAVDVQTEGIAMNESTRIGDDGPKSIYYGNMNAGGSTDYYDAASFRSNLWEN